MADVPAGWYPNPENPSTQRWWDGVRWSDRTRPRTAYPPPPPRAEHIHKPDNHLTWAIVVTLCCCLPFGVLAVIDAAKVDSLWNGGFHAEAHEAARSAKKWIGWGLVLGVIVWLVWLGVAASGESNSYDGS